MQVERAMRALTGLGSVVRRSRIYRTKPWGVRDQPDFANAAVLLETALEPRALLGELKALETALGRVPTYRWGPRAIDLDILAYDDVRASEPGLVLPHPRLFERAFALVPLAEVDPSFAPALERLDPAERSEVLPYEETAGAVAAEAPPRAGRRPQVVEWERALERVRQAAEFCASSGLRRFRIEEEGLEIEISRSAPGRRASDEAAPPAAVPEPSPNGSTERAAPQQTVLKAEFVGIVRLSRPHVAEGAQIAPDRELAFVESLGVRNPVRFGEAARIAAVFVSDGQPVEYGQPLFALERLQR